MKIVVSSLHTPFSIIDVHKKACLIELECSTVQMGLESRPRTHGLKFSASVGGLYLRDKMTKNSIMPVLVAPQTKVYNGVLYITPP
mgnify:CR=1 FL=1